MKEAVVQKLMQLSNKTEADVTTVLQTVRAEAIQRFGNKNRHYKNYVTRVVYVRLGIRKNPSFKPK
jgi:hypothetical protein